MLSDNCIEGIEVASCGTKVPDGLDREPVMCRIAAEHGYEMGGKGVAMADDMLKQADLIIAMTGSHRQQASCLLPDSARDRIVLFNDYCFGEPSDLPDPHYQTEHVYRVCFDTIERGCREIINRLKRLQDKCRGSLIGVAVGDALGYEVEFMSLSEIRMRFGANGIADYVLDSDGMAVFSDDTQMTLFTADGLLCGVAAGLTHVKDILPYISKAYEYWYYTQSRPMSGMSGSWLTHIPRLWARRAPGNTCMSALHAITMSNAAMVTNNSKGCGGVMRVAPVGIFAATHPGILDIQHAGYLAGYAAGITHKHPLSTYSSMALAMIVECCIADDGIDRKKFRGIVLDRVFNLLDLCLKTDTHLAELRTLIQKALDLAVSARTDTDAIRCLGEGWVAEETLAIALFSVMRYIDDFESCIRCAVNHDGDSDSTGAVAGNIIGAILGYRAIPGKYLTGLELHDVLLSVADDLGGFSAPQRMRLRYRDHTPVDAGDGIG